MNLAAPDFDPVRLRRYLDACVGGASGPLELERTEGGMSNPTWFLRRGDWQAVLRKQPAGALAPSAHAIDREFRVLQALHRTPVPVPRPMHWCGDADIVGTPFYLMERLQGRVFHGFATPGLAAQERSAMFEAMVSTLVAIHRVDVQAVGLSDYGRPGNYFERQLRRWGSQWQTFRDGDGDIPALDRLLAWLQARVPASTLQTLCHGDFRIGNLLFHPTEPRVIGVLDWELSTLGHPLVDLAFNSQAWRMAPDENGGLLGLPLHELGIPSETAYLAMYDERAALGEQMQPFHQAFAMFRGAVGSVGVAKRGERGNGFLPEAARVGRHLALAYAQRGLAIAEASS